MTVMSNTCLNCLWSEEGPVGNCPACADLRRADQRLRMAQDELDKAVAAQALAQVEEVDIFTAQLAKNARLNEIEEGFYRAFRREWPTLFIKA